MGNEHNAAQINTKKRESDESVQTVLEKRKKRRRKSAYQQNVKAQRQKQKNKLKQKQKVSKSQSCLLCDSLNDCPTITMRYTLYRCWQQRV